MCAWLPRPKFEFVNAANSMVKKPTQFIYIDTINDRHKQSFPVF